MPRGSAGRFGEEVRGDLYVEIEIKKSGGIEIELDSKAAPYYGEKTREEIGSVLETLRIGSASVKVKDQGALPYVIAARVEAAARKAMPGLEARAYPFERMARPGQGRKDRPRRTRLYLPGSEPRYAQNAGLYAADGVILDLEDSVAPGIKDETRILARNTLLAVDFGGSERMVRINQGDLGLEDLEEVVYGHPDTILVPKAEDPEEIARVDEKVREIQARIGDERRIWLLPIIESAEGVLRAVEIARATDSICGLAIGLEDLTADLGVRRTLEGTETLLARQMVVLAARSAGIPPLDTVFSDVGDEEGLRRSVRDAKALGFEGKGCIHPSQVGPIHEEFAPSKEEVEKAKKIRQAFEEAEAKGLGVVALGTKMIDPPVVKRALRILELARIYGMD